MNDERVNFAGTYFDKDAVLKISRASRLLAWAVLGVYAVQLLLSLWSNIIQISNGFWVGLTFLDQVQNFLFAFQQPLHGVVYFFALLGISHLLLIFMDVEDNTRRAARQEKSGD